MSNSPLDLARFLPYRLNVLAERVSKELARVYESRFGLSIPEWRLLAHLANNDRVSVREVFEKVALDKPTVSRAAARLETAGLIAKRVNAGDRRLVELSLTPAGRDLFAQVAPLALAYERRLLDRLDEAERTALEGILEKLSGDH